MAYEKDIEYLKKFQAMLTNHYKQVDKFANKRIAQRTVKYGSIKVVEHAAVTLKMQLEWLDQKIKSFPENNS